jgi:hypothetical protein
MESQAMQEALHHINAKDDAERGAPEEPVGEDGHDHGHSHVLLREGHNDQVLFESQVEEHF